jgi:hypothetical protein
VSDPRRHAHELIDCLPETQLSALVGLLETIVDPRHTPMDEEPITDAERKAVAEADEWLKHNEPIPHEEVLAEFGLTMADWEKMADEPLPEELLHRATGQIRSDG